VNILFTSFLKKPLMRYCIRGYILNTVLNSDVPHTTIWHFGTYGSKENLQDLSRMRASTATATNGNIVPDEASSPSVGHPESKEP